MTYRLSVAPMMAWTDRHCRYFHRLLAPRTLLYTEMVTTGALLHGDPRRLLDHDPAEHPLALQLGGSEPDDLARAVNLAADWQFDEINLNCGCPSERVQRGAFGACLMAEPNLVADCVAAMAEASTVPVTVKCRIGIDQSDDFAFLERFVDAVAQAGCPRIIIHARNAWLKGLSPKQNREVPPLNHERVRQIKRRFPGLMVIVNGGLGDPEFAAQHIRGVDGVMIGREAYHNPYSLIDFETMLVGPSQHSPDRFEILDAMTDYADRQAANGVPVRAIGRHLLGLFNGRPGAKAFRRTLSDAIHGENASPAVIREASRWCRYVRAAEAA